MHDFIYVAAPVCQWMLTYGSCHVKTIVREVCECTNDERQKRWIDAHHHVAATQYCLTSAR